jgi:DNA repair exonuclease SbcCD ATPase subunit
MILFKTISWKNFLSTGQHETKVDFTESGTTLIIGSNGAGKSTILDALTFSLYGKAFRKINKPQLVNSINEKDCRVEIDFDVNNVQWKVVRGIKPAVFEIYRDGKPLDQSASAVDQQKWLEQNVLKMNYKSFTQIVVLGSSTFVPFMQLTASSRREVIEDLLDIKIFSAMNSLIKDKIRVYKDESRTLELKKESLKDKVEMQQKFIKEIETKSQTDIKYKEDRIGDLGNQVTAYMQDNEKLQAVVESYKEELKSFENARTQVRKLNTLKGKISAKIAHVEEECQFFNDNRVCPTCNQDLEEEFRLNRITDSKNKQQELQKGFQELEEAILKEEMRESNFNNISDVISNQLNGITKNNTNITSCQKQIKQLESEIQTIAQGIANRNSENVKLKEFKTNLQKTYTELGEKREKTSYYDFTYNLLKDGGVKTKIIKKYLPLINQQVNKYLQMMDFYINFSLDEEFNETIQSPIHEDFSYSSFSEGEKMRIDLALLFTWREVARFKNSVNTNLLIMDEVFDSSLDGFGTDEFLKIIKYVISDANIFVISHKTGMEDRFQSVIKFEKKQGFSRMV